MVLAAGTLESAKIALAQRARPIPSGMTGRGITDHPILFQHFSMPVGATHYLPRRGAKLLGQHRRANAGDHPPQRAHRAGTTSNQGRYVDDEIATQHRRDKGEKCSARSSLPVRNAGSSSRKRSSLAGRPGAPLRSPCNTRRSSPPLAASCRTLRPPPGTLRRPADGRPRAIRGGPRGRRPRGGDVRLAEAPRRGVVDLNLKFHGHDALYVCDLSVFASSPAANPRLTLTALAIRLADHLAGRVESAFSGAE